MYNNIRELLDMCESEDMPLWKAVVENEKKLSDTSEEQIFETMAKRYEIMTAAAKRQLGTSPNPSKTMINGLAKGQFVHAQTGGLSGSFLNRVMAYALSCSEVNASMGKICAAPTAGSCGILPAVMVGVAEERMLDQDTVYRGLITAAGIGAVITQNATVSGAEGGCQAECGVAAGMAAAAVVEMLGGTPRQSATACSLALVNVMGLVCDPVAGLVQIPCAQRNASQAVNAIISADMALAGMPCIIPPDEVIDAMYQVGRMLPCALKETALGGIAATPTGKKIFRSFFSD
ncbi:L-serine ammonia-lyase, iron-sulfur-dependent, subunit alpha [Acetobacterium bakii]|uniref:L-serine dehydratase n=1 Tax=Acetobacterium bakii TaxID=52689 RepID=A0A0L6U154_9FIRM|nr:L-serine ammonia-lyase, iron-sulfur-dependent, subunit alpha [Acetobacterium bakii]KNZ42077.1 serine dehydratase [Acetobacterium bakii]